MPSIRTRGASFGKGIKLFSKINDLPSPTAYDPKAYSNKIPIKMKGYISEKIYAKNLEKYYKGKIGPGPAGYTIQEEKGKGMMLPKAEKLVQSNS